MEEDYSIDSILGDLSDFNEIDDDQVEDINILLIGRKEISTPFLGALSPPEYSLHTVTDLETAADLLLRTPFAIILLDYGSDMDVTAVSNLLRKNYSNSRIVMIYDRSDFMEITELYNNGSFDGIITYPTSHDDILKKILQQEAQYAIQKEVTSFVSEPPEMSKASFLLLDPSLDFGDPNLPLNFVGVMVVVNTVPRYNIFFEDTLASDEILFAAFLSSITSLGDELFQSKQSLKEINFGGISVIFRFHDSVQLAFLVENLTRHNYENADRRIDELMDKIFPKYEDLLLADGLTAQGADRLDSLFTKFDMVDEEETKKYESEQKAQEEREFGTQVIILLSLVKDPYEPLLSYVRTNSRIVEGEPEIVITESIDNTSQIIQEANVGVVMIDDSVLDHEQSQNSGLFIMESIEELDPAVQIIYFSPDTDLHDFEIELLNSGNLDYIHYRKDHKFKIFASVHGALKKSLRIKRNTIEGVSSGSKDGLAVAKSLLKENLEAFNSEERPALQGVVIAQNKGNSIDPIFSKFYELDGEVIDFDVEMMAGLVTSLKQVSGEMFMDGQEKIDELELAGHNVFIRFNADFLFIYFVKNITPNTSILIAKELDAVTVLFSEIIAESLGMLSAEDLSPIFSKISMKAHESLTSLLQEQDS